MGQQFLHSKLEICHLDNPEFTKKPEDVSADSGQEILLECLADGNPSPSYRWFRNGDTTTVRLKLRIQFELLIETFENFEKLRLSFHL